MGTITSSLTLSSTYSTVISNNTLTFNEFTQGTYSNKQITVTNMYGNISNTLTIPTFTIDPSTILQNDSTYKIRNAGLSSRTFINSFYWLICL